MGFQPVQRRNRHGNITPSDRFAPPCRQNTTDGSKWRVRSNPWYAGSLFFPPAGICPGHRREAALGRGGNPPGAAAGIRPGPRRESARGRGGGGRGRMKASGRPAEDEPRSDGAELATWGDSPRSRLHTCRRRPFFTPPKEIWCREPGSSEGNMAMSHGWPPQQRRCLHWWSRFGMLSPPVEVKLEFDAIGGDVWSGVRGDRAASGFWRCVPATDAPAYSPVETRRHFVPTSGGRYRFRRRRWRCVVSRPGNPPTL